MHKAVVFDIGQTLVEYRKPLNWAKLYRPAMEQTAAACGWNLSEGDYARALEVLSRYNTRLHPRSREVPSSLIFTEILTGIRRPLADLERAKAAFYGYFRNEASLFPETEGTLRALAARGIVLGTLSDVAYGMDNEYALADIAGIRRYIACPWTSNDTGVRKPCGEGLLRLIGEMGAAPSETVFVGDEEKDVLCARNAGTYSVLIDRDSTGKQYGQDAGIHSLEELLTLI